MDATYQRTIEALLVSNDPVIAINRALGRDPRIDDSEDHVHSGWSRTNNCSLPPFLVDVLSMQFSVDRIGKTKDVFLKALIPPNKASVERLVELSYHNLQFKKYLANIQKEEMFSDSLINVAVMKANASEKEIAKQQILSHAPLFGHGLAAGGHPSMDSPPDGYDLDNDFALKAGKWFKEYTSCERKFKFTVPALSSQGMTLKSKQDTPAFRIYAKAIMATMAQRTKTRAEYDATIEAIDQPFVERGFDGVANNFYLGQRRQGTRKSEPVSSRFDFDGSRDYDLGATVGIQGRSRGIFPPSEYPKHYFKPFAEGIKKSLFDSCYSTFVELSFISIKLHYIALRTFEHQLTDGSGGLTCFYDLSAMDTTTHRGFQDSYLAFCRGVFPDFASIEGDTFTTSKLFFPAVVGSREFLQQEIDGRSTLSGQPDVTTKNNICHLLAMAWCLSKTFEVDPLECFKHIVSGSSSVAELSDFAAHVHGDDTMMYIDENQSSYDTYYKHLGALGFEVSFESAPIFLKKTLNFDSISSDPAFLGAQAKLVHGGLLSLWQPHLDKLKSKSSFDAFLMKTWKSLKVKIPTGYNLKYIGGLSPVVGSLWKNRFGEYQVKEPVLGLMALSDTLKLLGDDCPSEVLEYWYFLFGLLRDNPKDSEVLKKALSSCHTPELMRTLIVSDSFVRDMQSEIITLAAGSITKASSIRSALERLFYAGGELINDMVLESVFGSLFITGEMLEESFDLREMTLPQLIELFVSIQDHILDTGGKAPELDEFTVQAANKIIKQLGKL